MSAATRKLVIEIKEERRDVRAALRHLYFRRQLFRALARAAFIMACALVLLCILALIDYKWLLPRSARLIAFTAILFAGSLLVAYDFWQAIRRRTLAYVAREIERVARSSHNALVTVAEIFDGAPTLPTHPYLLTRLDRQARIELAKIDERRVAPRAGLVRGTTALALALLLILTLRLIASSAFALEVNRVLWLSSDDVSLRQTISGAETDRKEESAAVTIEELHVRVLPPAYSGLSTEEVAGDAPVRVLAGSRIEVDLTAHGTVEGATLSFNGASNAMSALGTGRFSGAFTANASGAFETRLIADERSAPASVVRAIEVYQDVAPEARITEPAQDQLLRAVPDAPIVVRWRATDDLGLASVALKYIKSRGLGDAAKFTNGEAGIGSVERVSGREWKGTTALDLRRLDVQPGDTLVFWIEARDRNPNVNTGRSASLAIGVSAKELAKLSLSDLMPNEIGRFLLSERQIIMHTEKLQSERARLSQLELKRRANEIAAEQREFKNSFNDYIHLEGEGEEQRSETGEKPATVEDEVRASENERTAPHFHGIPEPPTNAPTSVKEMIGAIRAMWDAEDSLTNADTKQALNYERDALAHLKRAQTAVRYVPPVVAQSKPLDLKRRYAGELAEIKTRLEKLARRPEAKESAPLRAALMNVYAALDDLQGTLSVTANARASDISRAREKSQQAADALVGVQSKDHAATIAEAAGQLRIVETELAQMDASGTENEFAARLAKPLALLTQAASNLFAIAESRTRAIGADANQLLPTDDTRAAEYFRRLAGAH